MKTLFMNIEARWQLITVILSLIAILFSLVVQSNLPLQIIIFLSGIPLLAQIIIKLLKGNLGADLLAALALVTGVLLEQYLASALIILMLASGQTLEKYAIRKASSVLVALAKRMPTMAHKQIDRRIETISPTEIKIKDHIVLYPHEICPVDGVVVEGHGSMDESYLTGEPYQISKTPGVSVLSGSINGESVLPLSKGGGCKNA